MWTVYINDLPAAVLDTASRVDQAFVNAINQSPQLFNHILATYNDGEITIENLLLQTLRIRFETDFWIGAPFIITGNPTATVPVFTLSGGLTFTVCLSSTQPMFAVTPIVSKSAYEIAMDQGFQGTIQEWLDSLIGPQGEPADPGALELVASTTAPDSQLEIGSYAPVQNFTILASDPHIVRTDTDGLLTLRVDRLRDGNTTTVATFEATDGAGQLSLVDGPAEFVVGDVLLVVIESCPSDCSRVSTTLSVRLQESAQ